MGKLNVVLIEDGLSQKERLIKLKKLQYIRISVCREKTSSCLL